MIENAKSKTEAMRPHTSKAKLRLLNISVATVDTEEKNSNGKLVEELDATLEESRQILSSMMAHYVTAAKHQGMANEAIAKSGISAETTLGEKVLGTVAQGNDKLEIAVEGSTSVHDFLQGLTEQVKEYGKVEGSRIKAGEEARIEIEGCLALLNSFESALDVIQGMQDV